MTSKAGNDPLREATAAAAALLPLLVLLLRGSLWRQAAENVQRAVCGDSQPLMNQQCILNGASVLGINYFTPTAQHDIWPSYKFHLAVPTDPQNSQSRDWNYGDWTTVLGSSNTWNRWIVEVESTPSSSVRTKHVIQTDFDYANRIAPTFWLRMQNAIQIPIDHDISNPRHIDTPQSLKIWLIEMKLDPNNQGQCTHSKRYILRQAAARSGSLPEWTCTSLLWRSQY